MRRTDEQPKQEPGFSAADAMFCLGFAIFGAALWLVWPPLTVAVLGLFLMGLGLAAMVSRRRDGG